MKVNLQELCIRQYGERQRNMRLKGRSEAVKGHLSSDATEGGLVFRIKLLYIELDHYFPGPGTVCSDRQERSMIEIFLDTHLPMFLFVWKFWRLNLDISPNTPFHI